MFFGGKWENSIFRIEVTGINTKKTGFKGHMLVWFFMCTTIVHEENYKENQPIKRLYVYCIPMASI